MVFPGIRGRVMLELYNNPAVSRLDFLDVHHHYLSDDWIEKLLTPFQEDSAGVCQHLRHSGPLVTRQAFTRFGITPRSDLYVSSLPSRK